MSRVALPHEERRRCLEDLYGALKLSILSFKFTHLCGLLSGDSILLACINPLTTDPPLEVSLGLIFEPGGDGFHRRPL